MRPADRVWQKFITRPTLLAILVAVAGCHSHHIEATIENHTGAAITLLEVDYPSASFGADILEPDGTFHHRIQTRGNGSISVQYTGTGSRTVQINGPTLREGQEGSIEIVLLPDGKAEFHPSLTPQP
ncbi:MAG: hypothetical protein WBX19_10465 [Terracidiphilus sp.]